MKTLLKLGGLVIVLSTILLLVSHFLIDSASHLSHFTSKYHFLFQYWHYGLYIVILLLWPVFIQKMGEFKNWPTERILFFTNQRLKLVALFIVIEVLFVYNALGHLLVLL